jgi:hypothetical protein
MRPEEEEKATLQSTPLAAASTPLVAMAVKHGGHATVAAALPTISPNVRNNVKTVIAIRDLEVEVNREGTEAVEDAEEDSTGPI